MKTANILAALLLLTCTGVSAKKPSHQGPAWQSTPKEYAISPIRDLVLIYQGGSHRPDWTIDQFEPYVTHSFEHFGKQWLFDGFLFLEFRDGNRQYLSGLKIENARKEDWLHYLDRLFEPGKALDALNRCIAKHKAELGDPGFRHKVVLTMLTPILHQKDWGELDGRALDFDNPDDCTAACRWYLDEMLDRFYKAGYDNLDLSGIYWLNEEVMPSDTRPQLIAPYVHEKGLQFIWIPYYKAPGYTRWRELGFDVAYFQPNHFFHDNIPDSRLDEACAIARLNGMAMELEFDSRALAESGVNYAPRLTAYIDAYWRNNVINDCALAYYEGGAGFMQFAKHRGKLNDELIDRLAWIIIDRRANKSLVPPSKH